ncbi:4-hydroxybenzoate polyprenyltransferase, mitochondrial isoform X2 [Aplysia californica]|uniref:4-hydroxybenzoate polyprenyltransferase, mitochondrial n=1 Tax=Aplysia californica TaxID=6500 RepID=A0ABM0JQR5_APLCA|nr:4-hydroxybenzoate polyprenyltransferase, mitochondrial isoform X2 [Aplysia californica]
MALTVASCTTLLRTISKRASTSLGVAIGKHRQDDVDVSMTERLQTCKRFNSSISCYGEKSAINDLSLETVHNTLMKRSRTSSLPKSDSWQYAPVFQYPSPKLSLSSQHNIPLCLHQHPGSLTFSTFSSMWTNPSSNTSKASHSTLSKSHAALLHVCDCHQKSHNSMSSFSPARLILESSPGSVQPYLRLIRFDKPIGTWLLYWPCTWSIALAAQPGCMPDPKLLALFGAGAFFMRGAGCIINDMWDKDFDAKVERTKLRPLAAGELTSFQALVFLGTQLSCALAILLQLNWYSVLLGASSLGLVILYPLAKRYTYWPQLMLGLTLNWGVLLGWSEMRGSVELAALSLYAACTVFTIIYDTIYSHQDKYDDMLIGVKSTALKLGDNTKPWLYGFTALMSGGLTTAGLMNDMTWPYYAAVAITCGRLAQQTYSVDLNSADDCAKTFRGNFYLGVVMFVGIIMANIQKSKRQRADDDGFEVDA